MPIYTPKAMGTVPRWDKYDGYVGNFRGNLAEDIDLDNEANVVLAVGLNSDGAVTIGSGVTGIKGLVIVPVGIDINGRMLDGGVNTQAGDVCDVGKHGEITNFVPSTLDNSTTIDLTNATGGKWKVGYNGRMAEVDWNISTADLKAAIVGLFDGFYDYQFTVTGTAGDTYDVSTILHDLGTIEVDGTDLTGTSPSIDVETPSNLVKAGTNYYGHNNGTVNATRGSDGIYVGHTVESSRLIVNVGDSGDGAANAALIAALTTRVAALETP